VVDPDAAFNGQGSGDPLLDPGLSVTAGSFQVNGVSIAVNANDSLNSVLARVTASAAGVTATFDAATETVKLTRNTTGPLAITLGSDTSGFLAATKLDAATTTTLGASVVPRDQPLSTIAAFANVQAGTITINGQAVSVTPGSDTLQTITDRLEALTGVSASVNAQAVLTLQSEQKAGTLQIADTSGLLAAMQISTAAVSGSPDVLLEAAVSTTGPYHAADPKRSLADLEIALANVNGALAAIFGGHTGADDLKTDLRSTLGATFDEHEAALEGILFLDGGSVPRITVDRDRVQGILTGSEGDLSAFLGVIQAVLDGAQAPLSRSESAERTETNRAEQAAWMLDRELIQLDPGAAAAMKGAFRRYVMTHAGPDSVQRLPEIAISAEKSDTKDKVDAKTEKLDKKKADDANKAYSVRPPADRAAERAREPGGDLFASRYFDAGR
jgi:hypothetical protein